MGSVFTNSRTKPRRHLTQRAKLYLDEKKTDRGPKNNAELSLQIEMCKWLKTVLPKGVHFTSDTGSGAFNNKFEKHLHNQQQSSVHQPDIKIFAARRGYHGLCIELKRDGFELRMKRNGTKIRLRKDKRGRIIERDYKIRLKGDWASLHIESQAKVLEDYVRQGYYAHFACGEEAFKKIVCWYFEIPYIENVAIF
jgi:hypothetical protein